MKHETQQKQKDHISQLDTKKGKINSLKILGVKSSSIANAFLSTVPDLMIVLTIIFPVLMMMINIEPSSP